MAMAETRMTELTNVPTFLYFDEEELQTLRERSRTSPGPGAATVMFW